MSARNAVVALAAVSLWCATLTSDSAGGRGSAHVSLVKDGAAPATLATEGERWQNQDVLLTTVQSKPLGRPSISRSPTENISASRITTLGMRGGTLTLMGRIAHVGASNGAPSSPPSEPDEPPIEHPEVLYVYAVDAPAVDADGLDATFLTESVPMVDCESHGNPEAISRSGDYGLLQLNRRWQEARANAMGYDWSAMLDPTANLTVAEAIWSEQSWAPWNCK